MLTRLILILAVILTALPLSTIAHAAGDRTAGVAAIDITPGYPIRLSGFAARTGESEGRRPAAVGEGAGDRRR
jgi:hypothetical protein